MNYLTITDEQINVAKRLENKGFLILIEVLQSMRDGKQISERGLAEKYDLGRRAVRALIKTITKSTTSEPLVNHERTSETLNIKGAIAISEPLVNHERTSSEPVEETKQIASPAKPKKKPLTVRAKALQEVEINDKTQDAYDVFKHWQQRFGHFKVPFTEQTRELIQGVLDSKYGKDGAIAAIEGCAKNPWYVENKRTNLGLILRQTKIDEFITYNETTNATCTTNNGGTKNGKSGGLRDTLQRIADCFPGGEFGIDGKIVSGTAKLL